MTPSTPHRSQSAWTMTELLIGIAIVAVLVAILIPMGGRVMEESKAIGCVANLRTYGGAVMAFIADNGNALPDRTTEQAAAENPLRYGLWAQPYLQRPLKDLRCPNINAEERKGNVGFCYSGNGGLPGVYPKLRDIPAPASRVVLAAEMYAFVDGFWVAGHFNRVVWGNGSGSALPDDEGNARRPQYHGSKERRGLHMYFLDGHIERISAPQNDWSLSPTYGTATEGYFYTTGHFTRMKSGKLIVP